MIAEEEMKVLLYAPLRSPINPHLHFLDQVKTREGSDTRDLAIILLSWYILPSVLEDGINAYVIPLAIRLAKGKRLPLEPLYVDHCMLGWMSTYKHHLLDRYDVVTHVTLLQLEA